MTHHSDMYPNLNASKDLIAVGYKVRKGVPVRGAHCLGVSYVCCLEKEREVCNSFEFCDCLMGACSPFG